jgi:hypothetical protein
MKMKKKERERHDSERRYEADTQEIVQELSVEDFTRLKNEYEAEDNESSPPSSLS